MSRLATLVSLLGVVLMMLLFSTLHNSASAATALPDPAVDENEDQQRIAQAYVDQLHEAKLFSGPIVTQIVPCKAIYRA
jgi:hypothetical protein